MAVSLLADTLIVGYCDIILNLDTCDGSIVWSNTKNTWIEPFDVMKADESTTENVLVGAFAVG